MSSSTKELFGGAITIILPSNLIDVADIRQVPDTQEVFLYPDNSTSFIIEVLQRVDPDDLTDAIKFHFDSVAHDNDAQSSAVAGVQLPAPAPASTADTTPAPVLLQGTQRVQKFNKSAWDDVRVLMALYRVAGRGVDLVLTCNAPVQAADGGAVDAAAWGAVQADFDAAARSLRIVDFGLFA